MSVFKRNPAATTSGESGKQRAVDRLRFARRVWARFLAVGVFLLAAPAHAQLYTGSVTGVVRDPSGGSQEPRVAARDGVLHLAEQGALGPQPLPDVVPCAVQPPGND